MNSIIIAGDLKVDLGEGVNEDKEILADIAQEEKKLPELKAVCPGHSLR